MRLFPRGKRKEAWVFLYTVCCLLGLLQINSLIYMHPGKISKLAGKMFFHSFFFQCSLRCRRDRDRMVLGFRCEFEPRSWRGVLNTTLCVKVCQRLATLRW